MADGLVYFTALVALLIYAVFAIAAFAIFAGRKLKITMGIVALWIGASVLYNFWGAP